MVPLTYEALTKYLKEKGYSPSLQSGTGQLLVVLKEEKQEFPLFLKIRGGGKFLQAVTFLPPVVKKETLSEVARILHLFNKEIDLPGFGLDEMASAAFYRLLIPVSHNQIDPEILEIVLEASKSACKTFTPSLHLIASGSKTVDQLLQTAEKKFEGEPR